MKREWFCAKFKVPLHPVQIYCELHFKAACISPCLINLVICTDSVGFPLVFRSFEGFREMLTCPSIALGPDLWLLAVEEYLKGRESASR